MAVCNAYVTGQGAAGHQQVTGRLPAGSQSTGLARAPRSGGKSGALLQGH